MNTVVTPVLEDGTNGQPVLFTQYLQRPSIDRWYVQCAVSAPDGGTAVLSGWKVPAKAGKQQDYYLIVMATPRIIGPGPVGGAACARPC